MKIPTKVLGVEMFQKLIAPPIPGENIALALPLRYEDLDKLRKDGYFLFVRSPRNAR